MTNFNIRIISDNVCPWCYIGKARLDKAIALYKRTYPAAQDDTFTVTWYPYYLDPNAPKTGIPLLERLASKFSASRLEPLQAHLRQVGQAEGINFKFDCLTGNTRDSHRVAQLAKAKGLETQNRVVAEIMRSYFEGSGDITSWDHLVAAAERGGLDGAEVRDWLAEGKGGEEVDQEVREAFALGVSGVPHFVIQGQYRVGGAQGPETFLEQFIAIKEKEG
ncbi:DSBA-like thioredoxin domain-containing protein [Sodiomyces alkalinus F11]|uniref:DSBA-like thioredoxin domain-containing protein n=1 Tax=Sodiomyces alkalinus (strain CBS 110278 / VKM F-3762 / F11) TaxID=1314773 RepID=A0A3N2PMP8_SODAK|nr:DSBA-like thioredoxin domain-containing protein [Sodiomyces alkalinus F11]ROT35798.1 DSBA-like thioredoxin domain-containing protein [Sodiomyces alkalinus F11]